MGRGIVWPLLFVQADVLTDCVQLDYSMAVLDHVSWAAFAWMCHFVSSLPLAACAAVLWLSGVSASAGELLLQVGLNSLLFQQSDHGCLGSAEMAGTAVNKEKGKAEER